MVVDASQRATPVSAAMAERVICNCAVAIQSMLKEAAQLEGTSLNGYASTVTSICRGKLTSLDPDHSNGLSEVEVHLYPYPANCNLANC